MGDDAGVPGRSPTRSRSISVRLRATPSGSRPARRLPRIDAMTGIATATCWRRTPGPRRAAARLRRCRARPARSLHLAVGDRLQVAARRAVGTPFRARRAADRASAGAFEIARRARPSRCRTCASRLSASARCCRLGILRDELLLELLLAVAELNEAEAAVGGADHQLAERRLRRRVRDRHARAAGAVLLGVMPRRAVGALVDAAARAEAGVVDRAGHVAAGLSPRLQRSRDTARRRGIPSA